MHVRYSPVANSYEQIDQDDQTILVKLDGWQNGTFKTKSLFMKEEHDWKVVYLARIGTPLNFSIFFSKSFSLRLDQKC